MTAGRRGVMAMTVGGLMVAGGLAAGAAAQDAARGPGAGAQAVECGLVAPDFKAPLRIFSPDFYTSQRAACIQDRMALYKVPGVTMALIDGSRIAWTSEHGVLEAGTSRAVTRDSVFEAASATKLLTTVLTLQQVDRGRLDLDRDVNTYLKSWKVPSSPLTASRPVTLRLLLTHRAGINRPANGLSFDDAHPPALAQVLAGTPPATNQGAIVERAPGSGHSYSNIAFLIVQMVLEDVTGEPYGRLAEEMVFRPLGMKSSTLSHPLSAEWRSRWGVPHDEKGVARPRHLMPQAVAHGGLVTSASDLARLALGIADAAQARSTRLLSKRSAELMLTRQGEFDAGFGAPLGQGLGAMLLGEGRGLHFLHPGGNDPGANCWVILCPATGKGAVIMTNAAGGEALMLEVLASIAHVYDWPNLARH